MSVFLRLGVQRGVALRGLSTTPSLSESITERLRRLSQTPEQEFKPSEAAVKKREERERNLRQSGGRSLEEFDQRRSRPRDFRPKNEWRERTEQQFRSHSGRDRDWQGSKGGYNREPGRSSNYNSWNEEEGRGGRSSWHDEERGSWKAEKRNNSWNNEEFDDRRGRGGQQASFEGSSYKPRFKGRDHRDREEGFGFRPTDDERVPNRKNLEQLHHLHDNEVKNKEKIGQKKKFRDELIAATGENVPSQGDFSEKARAKVSDAEADVDPKEVLAQVDSDTFGTLSAGPLPVKDYVGKEMKKDLLLEEAQVEHEDEEDDVQVTEGERMDMLKLVKKIKGLVDEMKVKEAVDLLFATFEKGGFNYDKHKFRYVYNLLISSCAQVGYVKMAFHLFSDMKKRGFTPRESTFTALFNSTANSSWDAENNLKRLAGLREHIREKGLHPPNRIMYHALIKGYGRNGGLEEAFGVVDEMVAEAGLQPDTETFNMLLQACITDTEGGYRPLLITWRKMEEKGVPRDIYSYNLLLRGIRECGIKVDKELLKQSGRDQQQQEVANSDSSHEQLPMTLTQLVAEGGGNQLLDLICLNEPSSEPMTVSGLSYKEIVNALQFPQNRLAVLGGLRGMALNMAQDKVGPNLKTVTELGQVITNNEMEDLMMFLESYKIRPDVTFFNLIMKRNYELGNPAGAKQLMTYLSRFNLTPDILTWGVHAGGVRSKKEAIQLLQEMDDANFTPNIQIMGSLLSQGLRSFDPFLVLFVMNETTKREVPIDQKFVLMLEEFKILVKKGIIEKESGKEVSGSPKLAQALEDMEAFEEGWKRFLMRYESWVKTTEVKVEPKDPWKEDFGKFQQHKSHSYSEEKSHNNSEGEQRESFTH